MLDAAPADCLRLAGSGRQHPRRHSSHVRRSVRSGQNGGDGDLLYKLDEGQPQLPSLPSEDASLAAQLAGYQPSTGPQSQVALDIAAVVGRFRLVASYFRVVICEISELTGNPHSGAGQRGHKLAAIAARNSSC